MARAQLNYLVTTSIGSTIVVVNDATVTVIDLDGDAATLHSAKEGGTTVSNPLTTDQSGRVSAWIDTGQYRLLVEGEDLEPFVEYWSSVPGDNLVAYAKGQIVHGTDAGTARPSGFASIEWVGAVPPVNAQIQDTWINTSGKSVRANIFDTTWPVRPTSDVVIWIGGEEVDDPAADMEPSDFWIPTSGLDGHIFLP